MKSMAVLFIFTLFVLTVYSLYLAVRINNRFSGQRWQIPSTVYSDITLLYPGQKINRTSLQKKIEDLGYRNVSSAPAHKGEMNTSAAFIDIFLNDLSIPGIERKGFPVRITYSENIIESIVCLGTKGPLPLLELEPEKMMMFFGPGREQRQLVSIDDVPAHFIHAVMAAEDSRFYTHYGIDPLGILRAFYMNLRQRQIRQGGSTLTQQLAKNYFLTPERTFSRKLQEALISVTLEIMYEKDVILEIYLNEIYFGQKGSVSVNGVGEASDFYFGKPVNQLSIAESAMIAGIIKAPNRYSPYTNSTLCRERRNRVLQAMHKNGWLPSKILEEELKKSVTTVGYKTYGRKAPYFIDYLSEQLKILYPPESLAGKGMAIYTTLDTQVQMAAEQALARGLKHLEQSIPGLNRECPEKRLQGAVIVMQPKTGHIMALVGGRDYSVSQFNRATRSTRQPGSAFKPFVYLSSLDVYTPASILSNEPRTFHFKGEEWEPQNFDQASEQNVSMRTALKKSYNLATVDLAFKIGLDNIVETINGFDFSTPFKPYPSLVLGAIEVVPIELARAFCIFAADGVQPYPLALKEVADIDGGILERRLMNVEQLTSPAKAFMITSMLKSAVTEGTARSLQYRGVNWPVAGKTGTTNNYRDAWFVGYTPDILALVWVGFDNGDSIFTTGSKAALPIWADLMNAIPQHVSGNWFKIPPGIVKQVICPESGLLAGKRKCPNPTEEFFLEENVPEKDCHIHPPAGAINTIIKGIKKIFTND